MINIQEGQVWRFKHKDGEWTLAHIGKETIIDQDKSNQKSVGRRLTFRVYNTEGVVEDEMEYWEKFMLSNANLVSETKVEPAGPNRLSKVD